MRIDPATYEFTGRPLEEDEQRLQRASDLGALVVRRSIETWSAAWMRASGHDEQLAILLTHHHLNEMLDAAAILIRSGSVEPARLQLRAAFEALTTLEFILRGDREQRGYAWLVAQDILERIKSWRSFDSQTIAGQTLAAAAAASGESMPTNEDATAKAEVLERMLREQPRWKEAYEECLRLKKLLKRRPAWHELFGGPVGPGLRTLAIHLGRKEEYEILYRFWSKRVQALMPFADRARRLGRGASTQGWFQELQSTVGFSMRSTITT